MFIGVLSAAEAIDKYSDSDKLREKITSQHFDIEAYRGFSDFVSRTKVLFNLQALVLDLENMEIDTEDLKKGCDLLGQFYSTRLIVCANVSDEEISKSLTQAEIYDVVDYTQADFEDELIAHLEGEKESFSALVTGGANKKILQAKALTQPKIKLPKGAKITIGIAGCTNRCGVTTLSLSVVNSLILAGVRSCYVDTENRHIAMFKSLYAHDDVSINGVPIANDVGGDCSIHVLDLSQNADRLEKCDIKILVSTSKLWELPTAAAMYSSVCSTKMVFSLAGSEDMQSILDVWGNDVFFMPYLDDVWHGTAVLCPWLKEMIEGEACG